MEKLTERQNDILNAIKKFEAENGYPPTVREIASMVNLSSPATIHTHLTNLVNKGYLKKGSNKNRTLELLVPNELKNSNDSIATVPLLGKVTAGSPIEAIEMPDQYIDIPAFLIPKKKEVFTLRVSGESMINVGIYDNDVIVVQRQNTANNGEIVVAMTDENEVTLKTFYKESDHFRLQPENDTMAPIILDRVYIVGKAIGLYRKL